MKGMHSCDVNRWRDILAKSRDLFHVHTWRCRHAWEADDRVYVERAISMGAESISFTDHCPLPGDLFRGRMKTDELPEYISSLNALRDEYSDRIRIEVGLETEYLPSYKSYYEYLLGLDGLDYLINGQHFYEISPGDYNVLHLRETQESRVEGLANAIEAAADSGMFRVIAHPDRIYSHCREWDDEICRPAALKIITAAGKAGIPLEINFASVRHRRRFRPKFWELVSSINEKAEADNKVRVIPGYDLHTEEQFARVERLWSSYGAPDGEVTER